MGKEEKESTEELTKIVKPTLGERMSSFFRMNKNSAEEKIVENLDKPDDALTEVVIDNKKIEENGIEDNKVDGKGDEEKTEKSEEKPTNEDETEEKSKIPEEDEKLKPEVVETETTKLTEPKEEE